MIEKSPYSGNANRILPAWILSSPRTGSTLLSLLLDSTGLFEQQNFPAEQHVGCMYYEHFGPKFFRPEYLTRPPLFNRFQYPQFKKHFHSLEQIEALLPGIRYIYLWRENFLESAVSAYLTAEITKLTGKAIWNVFNEEELQRYKSVLVSIDESFLAQHVALYSQWCKAWPNSLAARKYLTIEYQELSSNPIETLNRCLEFLRLPITAPKQSFSLPLKLEHPQTAELLDRARTIYSR